VISGGLTPTAAREVPEPADRRPKLGRLGGVTAGSGVTTGSPTGTAVGNRNLSLRKQRNIGRSDVDKLLVNQERLPLMTRTPRTIARTTVRTLPLRFGE